MSMSIFDHFVILQFVSIPLHSMEHPLQEPKHSIQIHFPKNYHQLMTIS
jgi:hypothetical protein